MHDYGITRIYSPDDGRKMGLEGMIEDVISQCDFNLNGNGSYQQPMTLGELKDVRRIARQITNAENGSPDTIVPLPETDRPPVLAWSGLVQAGSWLNVLWTI